MIPKKYPITCHTNHVGHKSTFVAIKGFFTDGNKYIEQAIKKGAKKIISQVCDPEIIKLCTEQNIQFKQVKNSRITLAKECAKTLNTKNTKTKIIGITGTKGKTTTTYIIEHILRSSNLKTALIGTIKNKILNQEIESINTTPESDFLHMFLNQCDKKKVDYLIMEVSSHALSLHRTYGLKFDAVGFTNLAQEHLDFYKTMIKYFQAKLKIFNQLKKEAAAIVNIDDVWGKKAAEQIKNKKTNIITLSQKTFSLVKKHIPKHMPGKFNLYNFSMAYLICKNLGIEKESILNAIKNFPGVPGRLQQHILKNGAKAFIDYAHNPSSMEEVLKTLRPLTKNLITVFGCGGDRDKTKRSIMGKIAEKYSNFTIITNDNPRNENPKKIISDILSGIKKTKNIKVIQNRKNAITFAAKKSNPKSIIAILGKGHETYHLIKRKKYHFDDFEEISKY
ncbi:MAG: UDP-N-acetylmuramoyl-L-alanyl-D-glutamate--2,6-diaminopimelate ligase [bacterium]